METARCHYPLLDIEELVSYVVFLLGVLCNRSHLKNMYSVYVTVLQGCMSIRAPANRLLHVTRWRIHNLINTNLRCETL